MVSVPGSLSENLQIIQSMSVNSNFPSGFSLIGRDTKCADDDVTVSYFEQLRVESDGRKCFRDPTHQQ